jgi:hypothetical protein
MQCPLCGRELANNEPVFRWRVTPNAYARIRSDPRSRARGIAFICEDCVRSRRDVSDYRQRPCAYCGRPVYHSDLYLIPRVSACSPLCQERGRNRRAYVKRHGDHKPTQCAACHETFTPTRSDAKFCSTRCRVRAHSTKAR